MIDFFNFHSTDRYTVDTILKLCLHPETANDSFKFLYGLANGDSDLQNSAKIEFVSLFQVHLAETCLSLEDRLQVLNEIEEENEMSSIIINAYERALKWGSFTGRIQSGDSKRKVDIHSPSREEINEYFKRVTEKLSSIALSADEPFSKQAFDSILSRAYDQINIGNFDSVFSVVEKFSEKKNGISNETRQKLRELSSDRYGFDDAKVQAINDLLEKHKPISIEDELTAFVILPAWINDRDEDENFINVSLEKAKELANKYIEDRIDWKISLDVLLKDEQRQTYSFAQVIGEKQSVEENKSLIDSAITILKKIPVKEQNAAFVCGLIYGAKDDAFTRQSIDKLILSEYTAEQGIKLIRYLSPIAHDDMFKVKGVLTANPDYLRNLEYLDWSNLIDSEVIELVGWVKEINYSFALEILFELLRKEKNRWDGLTETINTLLFVKDITSHSSFINSSLHIEDLFIKSINYDPSEAKIEFLVNHIIEKYDDFYLENEPLLNSLTYFLLTDHLEVSWPIFGEHFSKGLGPGYKLKTTLEKINIKSEFLLKWSNVKPEIYPPIAIKFMNIYKENKDGSLDWDVNAKKLIDLYGSNQKVLDNMHSKFTNYFMINSASASALYEKRKALVDQLVDHEFETVQEFAKGLSEYLLSQIKEEDKFGENYELENQSE